MSMTPIGAALRQSRMEAGLTITELARRAQEIAADHPDEVAGLQRQAIHRWESGDTAPSAPQAAILAQAMGLSASQFADMCGLSTATQTAPQEAVGA